MKIDMDFQYYTMSQLSPSPPFLILKNAIISTFRY